MKTLRTFYLMISFLCIVISANAYDVCIDGIYYNLVPKAKQASVTNNGSGSYSGDIAIPEKITSEGFEYFVTSISENAFQYCSSITSIQIPNSVTSIGGDAFLGCKLLTSIQIPNSVTSIGGRAFGGCTSLASIQIPNSVTSIGSAAFKNCSSLTIVQIPNSVTSIGSAAFQECSSLASIQIPNSVTSIGDDAFFGCSSLTFIQIPNSVTSIGSAAFGNCSSLTSIHMPNSVMFISSFAFQACENLTNVTLGGNIRYIDEKAFAKCPCLENIYCNAVNIPSVNSDAFENSYIEYANLYIPAESYDAYRTADVWKDFGNIRALSEVAFAESININAVKNILIVGDAMALAANVLPVNTTNKSVTWSSSNSDIISVNAETGEITAVAYGSAEITATAKDGSNVTGSITITVKAEHYALADGEDYLNGQEFPCDELTYTRSFTNTNWNALYVPFAMQYEDWAEDFEMARLNDVHQFDDDDDGEIDRTVLEVVKMKEGSATEPNTPYMIKAKEVGEKTVALTDATLYAAEENSYDVTSWFTRFTFTGTYSVVTDMATKGYYAMANGGLKQATSDAAKLGSFRWYLNVTDRNGDPAPLKAKKIFLSFDDGETTAIDLVEANAEINAGSIYSIGGVNVGNNKASLPKGLYINKGKKYLIK